MRKDSKITILANLPKLVEFADNLNLSDSQIRCFQLCPHPLTPLDFSRRPLHILSKPIHSEATDGQAVFLWWLSCGQHDHSRATPPHIHGSPSSVLLPHSHGNSSILLSLATARLPEGHRLYNFKETHMHFPFENLLPCILSKENFKWAPNMAPQRVCYKAPYRAPQCTPEGSPNGPSSQSQGPPMGPLMAHQSITGYDFELYAGYPQRVLQPEQVILVLTNWSHFKTSCQS